MRLCETEQRVTDKSVLMAAHRTVYHHPAAEEKGARHGAHCTQVGRGKDTQEGVNGKTQLCLIGLPVDCSAWARGLLDLRASPSVHSAHPPHTPCQISRLGVFEEMLSTGLWWGPQSKGKERPVEDWAGRRGMSPLPGGAESLGSYTQEGSSSLPPG